MKGWYESTYPSRNELRIELTDWEAWRRLQNIQPPSKREMWCFERHRFSIHISEDLDNFQSMGSTESYKKRKSIGYDWDKTNGCNSSSRITVDESQNNLTVGPRDFDQRLIALMKEIKTEIYPWSTCWQMRETKGNSGFLFKTLVYDNQVVLITIWRSSPIPPSQRNRPKDDGDATRIGNNVCCSDRNLNLHSRDYYSSLWVFVKKLLDSLNPQ